MKMKNNFCDGRQYEMWKSRDGGGNDAYKIFTSYSEEDNIPNTMHYVELLMTIMKMKNNFCNKDKYEMRKSRYRLGSNAYKIFTSWVEDGKGREMWKCWNGGGNNAYNIFMCQVEEGYIPNIIIYVKQFMTPKKIKNDFYYGHQYDMWKSQDGEGNNAYQNFTSQVEEGNIIHKQHILFGAVQWKRSNFVNEQYVNGMKPKS